MANLSITNQCNKKCVYCFATDTLDEYGHTYMADATFDQSLEYLKRSGLNQVRLLGGEPTLHPKFTEFVEKSIDQDFDILLFTNGLINNETLSFLKKIPQDKLSILLNSIHPNENNEKGIQRQKRTMETFGKNLVVGVNLYSNNQELDYLIDYVLTYHLKKEIRFGISHSVLSKHNTYLHPKDYKNIGQKIAHFKLEAKKRDIAIGFDCGFVPCMFPEDSLELLEKELKKAGNCCHPIIDMLTDGTFISCYPLNNFHKIKINNTLTAKDLIKDFENELNPYKEVGIFPYCSSCPLFNNRCNGGCMSFRIQRFVNQT